MSHDADAAVGGDAPLTRWTNGGRESEQSGSQPSLTEAVAEGSDDLDLRSTRELVDIMNSHDAQVAPAVQEAGEALAKVIDVAVERLAGGGRMVYVGAGTSGRLALLDAVECVPTFGLPPGLVQALMAGGPMADEAAMEDAEDDAPAGAAAVANLGVGPQDLVVGISASGQTRYVLGAVEAARRVGAATASIACVPGSPLGEVVDHPVDIVVGPEVIAGSTRLKAGTAQKLALNTLSTVAMIRLGRVHGNQMIHVQVSNDKLARRARRIVADLAGCGEEVATRALSAAEGDVKTAVVALSLGVSAEVARKRLEAVGGVLRLALGQSTAGTRALDERAT